MSAPSAEQFHVAELVTRALIRNLPPSGVMAEEDVRQMANEALVVLVEKGKAPSDPALLGGAIRHKLIDRLRVEGSIPRRRGEQPYRRPETPHEDPTLLEKPVLAPAERELLRLSFEDDLTPAGIAELTGRSAGSIAVAKRDALRALRGEMMPRALETLAASASGLSIVETARLLRVSPETIKTYRKQAIAALGARNTAHAVLLAVRRGLIE